MIKLMVNQPIIEFDVYLTLAGAAVTGQSKPAIYATRFAETSRQAVTSAKITWTENAGGMYHVKIADDGTIYGGTYNYLTRYAGELQFQIDASGSTYELANRYFQVVIPKESYIDDGGSDSTGDGSVGKPYATIDKAVRTLMGWDSAAFDREGNCLLRIRKFLTLPDANVGYEGDGINLIIRGLTNGIISGTMVAGFASRTIKVFSLADLEIATEVNVPSWITCQESMKNIILDKEDGNTTGTLIILQGRGSYIDGFSVGKTDNSLTSLIKLDTEGQRIMNSDFSRVNAVNVIEFGSAQYAGFMRNVSFGFTKATSYCVKVNSTTQIVCVNCHSDGMEAAFKTGSGGIDYYDTEHANAERISNSSVAADNVEANIPNLNTTIASRASDTDMVTALNALITIDDNVDSIIGKLPSGDIADQDDLNTALNALITIDTNVDTVVGKLPAGDIADQDDLNTALNALITIDNNVDDIHGKLPAGDIADQDDLNTALNALITIDTNVDTLLVGVNTNSISSAALISIDAQLSSVHGAGSWEGSVATSVNLNDNDATKLVIAKALKDQDTSATNPVAGSILSLGKNWENVIVDQVGYDGRGNPLTQRVRIFPTKTDADDETNVIATYTIAMSFNTNNTLDERKVTLNP